jgi:hypothetical protein
LRDSGFILGQKICQAWAEEEQIRRPEESTEDKRFNMK